ncbi:MAG: MFS transporter [Proteobacteria bacterium]|nr:MFS transporter [Pseudomonadota bacterium]
MPAAAGRVPLTRRSEHAWAAVAAATALNLPLGSIYAFSVFLKPIEQDLGTTRAALSFVFGLATICYVLGMNLAPALFGRVPAWLLLALSAIACGAGIGLSAAASGLPALLFGYGVLFGLGGGAAYIVLLQSANVLVQHRKGLLNGYIVGLYPAGAMIAAPLFGWANAQFGHRTTLAGLAAVLLLCGLIGTLLTIYAGARFERARPATPDSAGAGSTATFIRLTLVFFLAAAAGLMVLSQAAGMITAYGGAAATALVATTSITGAIAFARISGGWLVDRFPVPMVAGFANAWAMTGALILTLWPAPLVAAIGLAMMGMGYGFISGCTAGAVAAYWPPDQYGKIAGRIYIAWCVAAITLPILAGRLFDVTGTYAIAVIVAGCGNVIGLIVALGLPRQARAA